MYVSAVNKLLADKSEIIANFELMRRVLFDTTALEDERAGLQGEIAVVAEMIQKCVEENARVALDQAEYQQRYGGLAERFDMVKARLGEVTEEISSKQARGELVGAFVEELGRQDELITEFDERLWYSLLDYVTVYGEDDVRFTFKDGTEIRA